MDSAEVGYWLIIAILVFSIWGLRKQFYALYLKEGSRGLLGIFFAPFIVYYKFTKAVRLSRAEWADKVIEQENNR